MRFLTLYVLGLGVFLKRITDWYYTFFSIFWKRSLCFSLFIPSYHISLHITELACWYYFFTMSVMFFWGWLNFLLLSRHEVEINKYCNDSDDGDNVPRAFNSIIIITSTTQYSILRNTLGTQDLKNTRVSYNFLSFYSVILKLGTKIELVIL